MFEQLRYNPSYYQEVINNYNLDKKYNIANWKWGYTSDKKSIKENVRTIECPTIKDFNRELWDLFAEFVDKNTVDIIWGSPVSLKYRNPERKVEQYYDGLIFFLIREEFKECIGNQDVSHFMSCLIHFGYFNLDFNVID